MPGHLTPYGKPARHIFDWPLRICAWCETQFDPSWSKYPPIETCCDPSCRRQAIEHGRAKTYREAAKDLRRWLPR